MLPKVCAWITVITFTKIYWILPMHSNVTIKNVSWPHFSWTTLYTAPASCVLWLLPTLLCSLCTGYLEQYICFYPRFWHLGHLQNCSQNSSLRLRLHATPLTAIYRRLRFTLLWHTVPTEKKSIYILIIKIVLEVQNRQRQKHNTWHRYKH